MLAVFPCELGRGLLIQLEVDDKLEVLPYGQLEVDDKLEVVPYEQLEVDDKSEVVPYEQFEVDDKLEMVPYEQMEVDDKLEVVVDGMRELSSYEQGKGLLILLDEGGRVYLTGLVMDGRPRVFSYELDKASLLPFQSEHEHSPGRRSL